MNGKGLKLFTLAIAAFAFAAAARAEDCGDSQEGFRTWLESFKHVALINGISQDVVDDAFATASFDRSILSHDRGQASWQSGGNFSAFAASHISPARLRRGKNMLLAYAEPLERIEQHYGVPGPVLVAIWGLETDYGSGLGDYPTFTALATLAYDCRRSNVYRAELVDALMIVQRGLLSPQQMRGAWAGEIGQTQFMPSAYLKYGVTSNGERGGDLMRNSADALASTANFLQQKGWKRGERWGPGDPNFAVLLEWNAAEIYAKTIALFADRLAE
jgi:lytic murein transglycosylase